MSSLYMLWDESHLWGLIAWRALAAFGLPFRLVKGEEIAQGALRRKPPAALVIPGGTARRKALRLGPEGIAAIRDYIEHGGTYLGFCGGSGLGLTGEHSLGLCPWTRAGFKNRMLHLVSGHMRVQVNGAHPLTPPELRDAEDIQLPVWWPARFQPRQGDDVEVLATYTEPGPDFWVADLPLATLPAGTLSDWEALYGVTLKPSHLSGAPCLIAGPRGKGRYVLSYAHLETPGSATANRWLAHILETLTGAQAARRDVPCWRLRELPLAWEDPAMARAVAIMDEVVELGLSHFLLFERNAWLLGWRAGIPGANLNHLHALIRQAASQPPTPAAERFWKERRENFGQTLEHFRDGVLGYLLAERLAMTLSHSSPDAVSLKALSAQREALFGPPMIQGGFFGELVEPLEELVFRQLAGNEPKE